MSFQANNFTNIAEYVECSGYTSILPIQPLIKISPNIAQNSAKISVKTHTLDTLTFLGNLVTHNLRNWEMWSVSRELLGNIGELSIDA